MRKLSFRKCSLVIIAISISLLFSVSSYAKWGSNKVEDEFGDIVEGNAILSTKATGKFSNTATEDADLTVEIKYQFNPEGEGTCFTGFVFKFLEYNDNPANFDDRVFYKYKIGKEVSDETWFVLAGGPGTVCTGGVGEVFPANRAFEIAEALVNGDDVKIAATYNYSSEYNFTIEADGFAELYQPAMYEFTMNYIEQLLQDNLEPSAELCEKIGNAFKSLGDYEDAEEKSKEYLDKYEELEAAENK